MTESAATESWDDVPTRDCYTKVQGQRCGPEHGWASWLGTFYRCTGTRTPGVAVAALDGDERGVAAPTSPPLPVDTAATDDLYDSWVQVGWMPDDTLQDTYGVGPLDDGYLFTIEQAERDGGIKPEHQEHMIPVYARRHDGR